MIMTIRKTMNNVMRYEAYNRDGWIFRSSKFVVGVVRAMSSLSSRSALDSVLQPEYTSSSRQILTAIVLSTLVKLPA